MWWHVMGTQKVNVDCDFICTNASFLIMHSLIKDSSHTTKSFESKKRTDTDRKIMRRRIEAFFTFQLSHSQLSSCFIVKEEKTRMCVDPSQRSIAVDTQFSKVNTSKSYIFFCYAQIVILFLFSQSENSKSVNNFLRAFLSHNFVTFLTKFSVSELNDSNFYPFTLANLTFTEKQGCKRRWACELREREKREIVKIN